MNKINTIEKEFDTVKFFREVKQKSLKKFEALSMKYVRLIQPKRL